MALVITPDGRQVVLPDGIAAPTALGLTEYGLPATGSGIPGQIPPPPPPPPPPVKRVNGGELPGIEQSAPRGLPDNAYAAIPGAIPSYQPGGEGALPGALAMPAEPEANATAPEIPVTPTAYQKGYKPAKPGKAPAAPPPPDKFAQSEAGQLEANQAQQQAALTMGDVNAAEAKDQAAIKQAGAQEAQRLRAEANAEQEERRKGLAERQKGLDDAIAKEASYKIDDNRRWHNLGTGRKILAGISVALSALGDALMRKSGPNAALGIIQNAIREDVEAQVREREQLGKRIGIRKNSIDNYRQITGDLREAANLKIAEEYKKTADQMEVAAAAYASPKAKLAAESAAAALRGDAAKIIGASAESAFNRDLQQRQMRNAERSTAIAGGNLALNRQQFEWQKKYQAATLEQEAQKLALAGKKEEAKLVRERGIGGVAVPVKDEAGNIVGSKTDLLRNRDGSVFIPLGTEAATDKLRAAKAGADSLINIIDEVRALGPEFLSDTRNSDKLQKLKTLWGAATVESKQYLELGVLAGPDMEVIERFLGTADPTQWKDVTAAIDQSRKNIVSGMQTKLNAAGFDGVYSPPDLGKLGAPAFSPDDEVIKAARLDPNSMGKDDLRAMGYQGPIDGEVGIPATLPRVADLIDRAGREAQIDPKAKVIDANGNKVDPTPEQVAKAVQRRDQALAVLAGIAKEGRGGDNYGGPFGVVNEGERTDTPQYRAKRILQTIGVKPAATSLGDPRARQSGAKDALDPRAAR